MYSTAINFDSYRIPFLCVGAIETERSRETKESS